MVEKKSKKLRSHMCIILYIAFWYDVHVNEHYTLKYPAFLYGGAI